MVPHVSFNFPKQLKKFSLNLAQMLPFAGMDRKETDQDRKWFIDAFLKGIVLVIQWI